MFAIIFWIVLFIFILRKVFKISSWKTVFNVLSTIITVCIFLFMFALASK